MQTPDGFDIHAAELAAGDLCRWCGRPGCVTDTVDHHPACPVSLNLYPLGLDDPEMLCFECDAPLVDTYTTIPVTDDQVTIVCVACALRLGETMPEIALFQITFIDGVLGPRDLPPVPPFSISCNVNDPDEIIVAVSMLADTRCTEETFVSVDWVGKHGAVWAGVDQPVGEFDIWRVGSK